MNAEITGIGWITAAGMGCGKDHENFFKPSTKLPENVSSAAFDASYPYYRRMDQYSRLGLTAIDFALQDAGLAEWREKRNIGIIASTLYGCLGTDVDYYDTVMAREGLGASPALFSYTLPNTFLGEAAIRFGLTGTSFVINELHPSGLSGLQMALDHIACGEIEKILCGVCEIGCPPAFSGHSNVPSGAIFIMIEKLAGKKFSSYGKLHLNKTGCVIFNGGEIKDLTDLVQRCIAGYRSFS